MLQRDEVIRRIHAYIGHDLLAKSLQKDVWLANGIQILGKPEVSKIVVGVSATKALFTEAAKLGADMILCKHPMRLETPNQILPPFLQERLRMVFQNNWTVGGYHYALDVHPEVGNVPLLLRALDAELSTPIRNEWGFCANLRRPRPLQELAEDLQHIVNHPVFRVTENPNKIVRRIAMVTGGAVPSGTDFLELLTNGVEAYITGEISEWAVHQFLESGIAYLAMGHHAGEVIGPQAFAKKLPEILDNQVQVEFINVWNEV